MAASQNGFCSYKLSINKNIMQIMTKNITFFINLIFYHRETRSFYDTFLELCKHRSVMLPLQNPPFCSLKEIKIFGNLLPFKHKINNK